MKYCMYKKAYIYIYQIGWHCYIFDINESINDAKNEDLRMSSPCLTRSLYVLQMTSQSIGDDVTMARQLWREHVTSDI